MAHTGAVAEWLNAHDSKSCIGATLSRVQIPSAPPELTRISRVLFIDISTQYYTLRNINVGNSMSKKYHFIAIGGIGMSGLAKYLLEDGHSVSGSDIVDSKYIDAIRKMGANVHIGHNETNLPDNADTVVISTAIRATNPELQKATRMGKQIFHRSDLLEEVARNAQNEQKSFIGFAGTHGKTTTSGMASYVLDMSDMKPAFVVGGIVPEIHTNAQHKKGNYFIAELDESDGTLVKYAPDILAINNLEEDHLDFYKNGMPDIIKTFNVAISKAKKTIINADDTGTRSLDGKFVTFGIRNDADYMAKNIMATRNGTTFDVFFRGQKLSDIELELTGAHNVYNALSVVAALNEAGVNINQIKNHFKTFSGMGRRFQKIYEFNGIQVYDDYAHHPTEINAVLDAAATKFGRENIVAVFQPHRYTRLKGLWNEFKGAFTNAGRVIVTDVFEASEDPIPGITGRDFAIAAKFEHIPGKIDQVAKQLIPTLKPSNVVVGLGAGTITALGKYIQEQTQSHIK